MLTQEVKDWLNGYTGNFPFYLSLQDQLARRGTLSPAQVAAVQRAIDRESQPRQPKQFSMNVGERIEIKAWIARRLAQQFGMTTFLRNLEVTQIHAESYKAYQVSVKFISDIACTCHVCGKALDTEVSRATGIGPVCAKKIGVTRPTMENAPLVLKELEEFAQTIGEIGPMWIPKSQMIRRAAEQSAA